MDASEPAAGGAPGRDDGVPSGDAPPPWSRWVFVSNIGARARRPIDVVTLLVGATIVLFTALGADQVDWLESVVVDMVEDLPTWLEGMFVVIWAAGLIYAGVLIGLVAVQGRSRVRLLRDLVLVVVASLVLGVVLSLLVSGTWPDAMPDAGETEGQYPVLRVAAVTAVLIVAGPHLVRPFRRLGWLIVILLGLAATGLRLGMPSDVVGGIGVALVAAGGVLAAFGSPRGYPDVSDVEVSRASRTSARRCWFWGLADDRWQARARTT